MDAIIDKILVYERLYEKNIFIYHVAYKTLQSETPLVLV